MVGLFSSGKTHYCLKSQHVTRIIIAIATMCVGMCFCHILSNQRKKSAIKSEIDCEAARPRHLLTFEKTGSQQSNMCCTAASNNNIIQLCLLSRPVVTSCWRPDCSLQQIVRDQSSELSSECVSFRHINNLNFSVRKSANQT